MGYEPLPGDYGVVRIHGPVGIAIRLGQWLAGDGFADYEHAYIYVGDGNVIEGRPDGAGLAKARPGAAYYQCPDEARDGVVAAARSMIGTPYSYLDYLAIAGLRWHLPGALFLETYVGDTHHAICSQLVDACYQRAGVRLFTDGRAPGNVTPGDLYRLIRAQHAGS